MKKKILLTGGNSFVGKNLRESFLSEKYEIAAPRSFELNLADRKAVKAYFQKNSFDAVIHSAIKPGHRNAGSLDGFLETNLAMFDNLTECRSSFGRFINIGSGAVYDTARNNRRVKESELEPPESGNLTTLYKYALHGRIAGLDNFYDLNLFGIFGRYEDWEIRFISNAICKALHGMPVTMRQNRIFSYLWAPDLAPVIEHFIENTPSHGKFYNVTPDEELSLKEAADIICRICLEKNGHAPELKIAREGNGLSYSGDNSLLRAEMPEIRFTPAEKAIRELYAWYEKNIQMIDRNLLLRDK